jgi:hypothetical protein
MNPQQIRTKISELDSWLTENPSHPDAYQVLEQKRDLAKQLLEQEPPRTYERDTFDITEQKIHDNE